MACCNMLLLGCGLLLGFQRHNNAHRPTQFWGIGELFSFEPHFLVLLEPTIWNQPIVNYLIREYFVWLRLVAQIYNGYGSMLLVELPVSARSFIGPIWFIAALFPSPTLSPMGLAQHLATAHLIRHHVQTVPTARATPTKGGLIPGTREIRIFRSAKLSLGYSLSCRLLIVPDSRTKAWRGAA